MATISLNEGDALILVDVQNDFLPGGALAVPRGDEVVPVLNAYIALFRDRGLPVYASRDWHPAGHCSFAAQGGPWPPHCVAGTAGAAFSAALALGDAAVTVSKAQGADQDAYSAFQGTGLAQALRGRGVSRVFIGGLATDYCVLHTMQDALKENFWGMLLCDATRAVDVRPGDGDAAIQAMIAGGAQPVALDTGHGQIRQLA
ncbi:MAG: isochorismatase family protein [Noviherbaspirillum sp.]